MNNQQHAQQFPEGKEKYVHDMFSRIAGRYDVLNRVMSFRRDVRWRRYAADAAALKPGDAALDVATGTGDLAFELARRVGPKGRVVGVDFVEEMLTIARAKAAKMPDMSICTFSQANALELPFEDDTFRAATIGFALRNVTDIAGCLAEMRRVVAPGGRVVSLELSKPVWPVFRHIYYFYFYRFVPVLGRLGQGVDGPYTYLPHSLTHFPDQASLADIMRKVGLKDVQYRNLTGGIAAIHVGTA